MRGIVGKLGHRGCYRDGARLKVQATMVLWWLFRCYYGANVVALLQVGGASRCCMFKAHSYGGQRSEDDENGAGS